MNNLMHVEMPWPDLEESLEAQRLEDIRRVSNVIQALENVVSQCQSEDGEFDRLSGSIEEYLIEARWKLQQLIHQPLAAD